MVTHPKLRHCKGLRSRHSNRAAVCNINDLRATAVTKVQQEQVVKDAVVHAAARHLVLVLQYDGVPAVGNDMSEERGESVFLHTMSFVHLTSYPMRLGLFPPDGLDIW